MPPRFALIFETDFVFDFAIPKLYSNALVSTLNARASGTDGGMMELRTTPTTRNALAFSNVRVCVFVSALRRILIYSEDTADRTNGFVSDADRFFGRCYLQAVCSCESCWFKQWTWSTKLMDSQAHDLFLETKSDILALGVGDDTYPEAK